MVKFTKAIRLLKDFMLDKILKAFKPTPIEEPNEPIDKPNEPPNPEDVVPPKELDPVLVDEWGTRLTAYVYDEELAKELAPIFVELLDTKGFDKVLELLDTKEKQIEAITSGVKKQTTAPERKQESEEVKPTTATDILKARYS